MTTASFARTGGPSRSHTSHFGVERNLVPHMPLDTGIHWNWRNPLNAIPASILAVIVLDIIALFI